MKLEKWALIAEIIGGVAIVLSLIYVGYQINQNTQQLRFDALAATVAEQNAQYRLIAANDDFADLMRRAENQPTSLSETERYRAYSWIRAMVWLTEADYGLALDGVLTADQVAPMSDVWAVRMEMPIYRDYWAEFRYESGPQFQEFMDAIDASVESGR